MAQQNKTRKYNLVYVSPSADFELLQLIKIVSLQRM